MCSSDLFAFHLVITSRFASYSIDVINVLIFYEKHCIDELYDFVLLYYFSK